MQDYTKLKVWQKSIDFVSQLYVATKLFPSSELYGLTNQMRRAAISISSNIAEGSGRKSKSDFARFLDIALGSAFEMECQILIAYNLGYLDEEKYKTFYDDINQIKKMLSSLINSVRDNY
jgi:four helix bundle protein